VFQESDKTDNEEGSEKEDGDQPEKEEAEQPANEDEETKKAEAEADETASQHFLEPYEIEGQKYYVCTSIRIHQSSFVSVS
jgi:hypothetical protein